MKKFFVLMLAMLWMSVAAFSQITISQEDYDKLPSDTRTQIEKITTEKVIKVYTDPNSHMDVYRVSVPGRVYYVLHNTTQGGLCKLL